MLSGGGGRDWGWSVCCGAADCWCEGLSGRGGCSGGVSWDECWCVSSGLHGTVYCDGVCRGALGSYLCSHFG